MDFLCFRDGLPVFADYGLLGLRVNFFNLPLDYVGGRCKYLDRFLVGLYMAVKFLFPLLVAFDKRTALHGDQHGVVKAVIMEL